MKKYIIATLVLICSFSAKAQFNNTDTLRAFINHWIRNSAVEAFQNLRLNTALIGLTNFADSSYGGQVKSFTAVNDTTARLITINLDTFSIVLRGNGITALRRRPGTDSIEYLKNTGTWTFAFKDSIGTATPAITQLTGDVTAGPGSGSQAATIANNAVTDAKLRQSAGHTLIGNPTGSMANVQDVPNGWGIAFSTGNILVDSAQVATLFHVDSISQSVDNRLDILENKQWYLDAASGNDLNDGRGAERAVKTVAKLLTLGVAKHDVVNVARGSYFREFMDFTGIDSLTIRDYGLGKKPIFDDADTAANSLFSLRGGTTNVYKITWTNSFGDNTDISQYGVWEDGQRLIRQTSIANVDATPGSFYYSGVTQSSGTDTIYVHSSNSSNVITNGRLYEITRRSRGIKVSDGCKVYNMHTKRNGSNNGSIETGHNAYVQGVIAEDGTKHNLYMASGTAENCIAWKCDSAFAGGTTMFVSFTTSTGADTMDVLYKNCIAIAGKNNDPYISSTIIGVYAHVGAPAPTYRSVTVDGGSYIQCATGIDGEPTLLIVKNANFLKCAIGVSKFATGQLSVETSTFAATSRPVSSNAPKIFFHHNKISGIGVDKVIIGNGADSISATYNTVNGGTINAFINDELVPNPAITFKHNIFTTNSDGNAVVLLAPANASSTNANIRADSNSYSNCIYVLADGTKTLANMQAIGKETSSTNGFTASRFYGDSYTSDFFLPITDAARVLGGSTNTFDSVYRFPYNVFNLPQNIFQASASVGTKSDLSQDNNAMPTHALNAQNLYIYKEAFLYTSPKPGDSSKRLATTEWVKQEAPVYRVYTALLNQTSTSDPVATLLKNNIGVIVWARTGTGTYTGTLTGAFTSAKTFLSFSPLDDGAGTIKIVRTDANTITITTRSSGTLTDALLTEYPLEIRVYP